MRNSHYHFVLLPLAADKITICSAPSPQISYHIRGIAMNRKIFTLLLLLCLLVLGCRSQPDPVSENLATTPPASSGETTAPDGSVVNSMATPQSQTSDVDGATIVESSPTSEPGKATIVGRVVSEQTNEPIPNVAVKLADFYRDGETDGGNYVLDLASSPSILTDPEGEFTLHNVNVGEYVIVVGDVEAGEGAYQIIGNADGTARVWNAEADQTLDAETLQVNLTVLPPSTPLP
jgi:hypothetical protein